MNTPATEPSADNELMLRLRELFQDINTDDNGDEYMNLSSDGMGIIDRHLATLSAPAAAVGGGEEERDWRLGWACSYSGANLYTDDGELQDNSVAPFIDWLHDSAADIGRKIEVRSRKQAAKLSATPAGGFVVVPREPTEAMIDAFMDEEVRQSRLPKPLQSPRADIYRAMIGAAPTAQPSAKDGVGGETRESRMVVVERNAEGTPTVWCDPEIVDLVTALNAGGIPTVASCSGHGVNVGNIALRDGRELFIAPDFTAARKWEATAASGLVDAQPDALKVIDRKLSWRKTEVQRIIDTEIKIDLHLQHQRIHEACIADLQEVRAALQSVWPGEKGEGSDLYYIQDTRQYVGNRVSWWGQERRGYVTRLDQAGKYTKEEAFRQAASRSSDVAWPCEVIDKLIRPTIDMQELPSVAATQPPAGTVEAAIGREVGK